MGGCFLKKLCVMTALLCVLSGCAGESTMETVADEVVLTQAPARAIRVELPEETVLPVMQTDTGTLYICRDFEVSVQTLPGGDVERTITSLTGFDRSGVTVMETEAGELHRFDLVWSCAGELGPEVGRASILSDGSYHYCLTVMTPEEHARDYQEIFNGMFESFTIC